MRTHFAKSSTKAKGRECALPTMTVVLPRTMEAKPHSPVYTMHKYFARRPWNVFSELIASYSQPGDIILDPFCGGGVTIVESLRLKRKAVGVDVNPLATYVTRMECTAANTAKFQAAFKELENGVGKTISTFYTTICDDCGRKGVADWIERDEGTDELLRLRYDCTNCGTTKEKIPTKFDRQIASKVDRRFTLATKQGKLWFPRTRIPPGDKTNSLLSKGTRFFYELFSKRNLLSLSMLLDEINGVRPVETRELIRFAFSSTLKWASRQSHLRGKIVEGWAMHAYWVYPKSLEINVWNTFRRRVLAIVRGKRFSNQEIGDYCRMPRSIDGLLQGNDTCLVLNKSSANLPIPDASIDAVITDPPYGGNVNYTELSDYWYVWLNDGGTIEKHDETIVNKTRNKTLEDYEQSLLAVFKECHRVLKDQHYFVSTFNSRDFRVVSSFVIAAMKAGFTLPQDGFSYQNPIQAYTTTFHAMQIGAFVGDFIFAFRKESSSAVRDIASRSELIVLEGRLSDLISQAVAKSDTEPQLRERAYRMLIPFLSKFARSDVAACREATEYFESTIHRHEDHFRMLRAQLTSTRRDRFSNRNRNDNAQKEN